MQRFIASLFGYDLAAAEAEVRRSTFSALVQPEFIIPSDEIH
jgi:hypothetical protein